MNLNHDVLRHYLAFGQETRGVELKAALRWEDYDTRLVKAIMAMANKRDGGVIIVGWDADHGQHGIGAVQAASFNLDAVSAFANKYADPYVDIEVQSFEYEHATFVAIGADEFRDVPIVCRADSRDLILRRGSLYVRSYRMPETTAVQTAEDIRELLEIATDKRIEAFVRQTRRAGLALAPVAEDTARARFSDQLGDVFG